MKHQNYFAQKEANKKYAQDWVEHMIRDYSGEIVKSINFTQYYGEDITFIHEGYRQAEEIPVIVKGIDSVSAVFEETRERRNKVCLLNFASYTSPGGMFIEGSNAQEECICRESTLYPVLNSFRDTYYKDNAKAKNKGLYLDRALYSPGIVFEKMFATCVCDVLTCAAPNYTPGRRYGTVTPEENLFALEGRCKFVLDIMQANHVDVPILGAFGCGVFSQDPIAVANIFKKLLEYRMYDFKKVVFAIIPGPNLNVFMNIFPTKEVFRFGN